MEGFFFRISALMAKKGRGGVCSISISIRTALARRGPC